MERKFSKISNNPTLFAKDMKSSQSAVTRKRKRSQQLDDDVYIKLDPPANKSRRIKPTQANKNGKGRPKQQKIGWRDSDGIKETNVHHESPKIWDIFERFQKFSQRKLLMRSTSGLLESADDEVAKEISHKNGISENNKENSTNHTIISNSEQTGSMSDTDIESLIGGDRKRRLIDCEDEQYNDDGAKRKPQAASTFKPKRLNFYEVDDEAAKHDLKTKAESFDKAKFPKELKRLFADVTNGM